MRVLVSASVDGQLSGIAAWYTKVHIAHCAQCASSIPFLTSLRDRLHGLDGPSATEHLDEDRWTRLCQMLDEVDDAATHSSGAQPGGNG
jgi:hypothetical protein